MPTPRSHPSLARALLALSLATGGACGGAGSGDVGPTTPRVGAADPNAPVDDAAPEATEVAQHAPEPVAAPPPPARPASPAQAGPLWASAPLEGEAPAAEERAAPPVGDLGMRGTGVGGGATETIGGAVGVGNVGTIGGVVGAGGSGQGYGRGGAALRGRRMARKARPTGAPLAMRRQPEFNTEAYAHQPENDFHRVTDQPLSTFSADVDTAAYANLRRFLLEGRRPPADAVRIEEMLNYFDYAYAPPVGDSPFSVHTEVASAPWQPAHRLVQIGLRGRSLDQADTPPRNLVFLLDVSGSMMQPDKLPLLKRGMGMLVDNLRPEDRVAIVVYAGASGLVLPSTSGSHRSAIRDAIERLRAGGSTNGAAGIKLAYRVAQDHFVRGGINRVILATDGDFNVGTTSQGALVRMIEQKRKSGTFLTVLGFGRGNLKDSTMERLANKGNGNYAYIDSEAEARKVLVREAGSTLVTIAKDVKLQVEFNPRLVESYRLIGYENRKLATRDFNDDKKDAGEMGAGHTVTALYEVVPRTAAGADPEVDALRYQRGRALTDAAGSAELATVKLRYKHPEGNVSQLHAEPIVDRGQALEASSRSLRFAAAVAGFGMLLKDSPHAGEVTLAQLSSLARGARGQDPHGDRAQLLELMATAQGLGVN